MELSSNTCKAASRCGACSLLAMEYPRQLVRKKASVVKAFEEEGLRINVNDVVGMGPEDPFHYRNKVIVYVTMNAGRISYGMYEENTHQIVYTPDCLLQNEVLNNVLKVIKEELDSLHIKSWDYGGVLKNILLRVGVATGQVLVVFVTSDEMFHGRNDLVKRITKRYPEIKSVVQNTNPRQTSVVLGQHERTLYGSGFIVDDLLGNRYKISARSFYQVNPVQTARLYTKALELAGIGPDDIVMDAYCGIGTIGLTAASKAGNVIGVEINRDAVSDAISNSKYNKVPNARFYCDDVKMFMREFDGHVDVLVVDPPRSGCDEEFLAAVRRLAPRRIVYISCNPATQARDVRLLKSSYTCGEAYPFDMFPHTSHVENIVMLNRKQ